MFVALCITVCLAIFALATVASTCVAEALCRVAANVPRKRAADLPFFWLRSLPLLLPVVFTLGFVLPSFLLLEPRHTTEKPEGWLICLASCAAAFAVGLLARALSGMLQTWKVTRKLLRCAAKVEVEGKEVFEISNPPSAVVVTGVFRPRIFIGRAAVGVLSRDELQAAVAHELAHTSSFDNLKRLFFHVTCPPRWFGGLRWAERSWCNRLEIEADECALRRGVSALDLGSAIVKVGRLHRPDASLALGCHLVPACEASALEARIRNIQDLLADPSRQRQAKLGFLPLWGSTFLLIAYLVVLPKALPVLHRLIEWIVQ